MIILHNIVHVVIGAAWIAGARAHQSAKSMTLTIGTVYGLVTVLGAMGLKFLFDRHPR